MLVQLVLPTSNLEMASYWNHDVGPAWVAESQRLEERLEPFTHALIKALELNVGESVLDVGCGTGFSSKEFSNIVGNTGKVVGIDISKTMIEAARAKWRSNEKLPITFIESDVQTHFFQAGAFDTVASRFGVMFFDNPVKSFRNLHKALKRGGRFVFVCWQEPRANPWFFIGVEELRGLMEFPEAPPPNSPGPFGLSDISRTQGLLNSAGFSSIEVCPMTADMPFPGSAEDMVDHLLLIGPVASALREFKYSSRKVLAIHERMTEVIREMESKQGLVTSASVWIVRAWS